MMEAIGDRGFYTIVPGTDYAAVSVHAPWCGHRFNPGAWIRTDIVHVGDDPLWKFLPEHGEDGPDNKKINAVHRRSYRQLCALSRSYGAHISDPMDEAERAENNKLLRHAGKTLPDWHSITIPGWHAMGMVREGGRKSYTVRGRQPVTT